MRTCLVADNSAVVRRIASHIFAREGYFVIEAATAEEGLMICRQESPELIVWDARCEGMAATDAIRTIRRISLNASPQIVFVTTENDPVEISRSIAAGATHSLVKPYDSFDVRELMLRLNEAA